MVKEVVYYLPRTPGTQPGNACSSHAEDTTTKEEIQYEVFYKRI